MNMNLRSSLKYQGHVSSWYWYYCDMIRNWQSFFKYWRPITANFSFCRVHNIIKFTLGKILSNFPAPIMGIEGPTKTWCSNCCFLKINLKFQSSVIGFKILLRSLKHNKINQVALSKASVIFRNNLIYIVYLHMDFHELRLQKLLFLL